MVGTEHRDVVRLFVVDEVERLQDGVRAAEVPARAQALLGRDRLGPGAWAWEIATDAEDFEDTSASYLPIDLGLKVGI